MTHSRFHIFRLLSAFIVITLLTSGALACGGKDKASPVDSAITVEPTSSPTPPSDPVALTAMTATVQKLAAVSSYRATISSAGPGGSSIEGSVEFVAPDRVHIILGDNEIISIGRQTYARNGNTWEGPSDSPTGFGSILSQDVESTLSALKAGGISVGGNDTVEGKACKIYKSGTLEFCIGEDQLPIRIIETADPSSPTTVIFKAYNVQIDIQAPEVATR